MELYKPVFQLFRPIYHVYEQTILVVAKGLACWQTRNCLSKLFQSECGCTSCVMFTAQRHWGIQLVETALPKKEKGTLNLNFCRYSWRIAHQPLFTCHYRLGRASPTSHWRTYILALSYSFVELKNEMFDYHLPSSLSR